MKNSTEVAGTEPSPATSSLRRSLARPPSRLEIWIDRSFRWLALLVAWLVIALLAYIVFIIGRSAIPAINEHGLSFLAEDSWSPNKESYGVWPQIWGTLYSSILALMLAGFFGIAIAIYLTQDFLPRPIEILFKNIVELLAAIPSVVYGLWGLFIVVPGLHNPANWLHKQMGWFPLFSTPLIGPGMLPATLVLAIMILPTVTAVARDALGAVPLKIKEAAYGLGATRWEAILRVILPTAGTGVFAALVLAFGRALGETMALAMLIGGKNKMSVSLFAPGNSLAALIASKLPEANSTEEQALMYAALVLMGITLSVNILGRVIVRRALKKLEGIK